MVPLKYLLDKNINLIIVDNILNQNLLYSLHIYIRPLKYLQIPVCTSSTTSINYTNGILDTILSENEITKLIKHYIECYSDFQHNTDILTFKRDLSIKIRIIEESYYSAEYEKMLVNIHKLKNQCKRYGYFNYMEGLEYLKESIKSNNLTEFIYTLILLKKAADLIITNLEDHFKI